MQEIKNNTHILQIFLKILIGIVVISFCLNLVTLDLLQDIQNGNSIDERVVERMDTFLSIKAIGYLIAILISYSLGGIWIYRANKRLRLFGVENLKFSPAGSVGWHLVPLMNLFQPYRAMREIWFASDNPKDWTITSSPALLKIWWALWLVFSIVNGYFLRNPSPETLGEMITYITVNMISDGVEIPLTFSFLFIVKKINTMQLQNLTSNSSVLVTN